MITFRFKKPSPSSIALAFAVVLILAVSPFGIAFAEPPATQLVEPRPNVVFIIGDDQAWTDYGFMGHGQIETPHLDRLSRESLCFTRGYVPTSLCRPSLATIISGQYPHAHRIVGNDPPADFETANGLGGLYRDGRYQKCIEAFHTHHIDQMLTLPDRLSRLGYHSLQTGKWWEGRFQRGGFTDGMTHGDPTRGGRHGDEGLKIGREGLMPIKEFLDARQADGQPYFVWYAPFLPHTPHDPEPERLAKYLERTDSPAIAKYWANCERFDETVGELLQMIDESKSADNTIVMFVCDNGWINQRERSAYAPRSKRSPYDGGVRTPIMLRFPTKVEPRRDDATPVSSIDMIPTVLQLLGQDPDPNLPGVNLLDADALSRRNGVYGEIFDHDMVDGHNPAASLQYRWIIEGNLKLIVPDIGRIPDQKIELFNLADDPYERTNLADKDPGSVQRLQKKLDAWWPGTPTFQEPSKTP